MSLPLTLTGTSRRVLLAGATALVICSPTRVKEVFDRSLLPPLADRVRDLAG